MIQNSALRLIPLAVVSAALLPLSAQTTSQHTTATHHTAAATAHHALSSMSRCPVPAPELSPKIPATPAALGCPRILYALTYVDLKVGTGELAQPRKWYTVHYTGYLADGTKFDSSYDHPDKQPITFPYGAHRVIPGWDTGFEGMHIGGRRRLFIPYPLAYGEAGRPPVIPPKSELIFDIELISQSDTPPTPPPGAQAIPPQGRPQAIPPPPTGSGTPPPGSPEGGSGTNPGQSAPAGTPPPTSQPQPQS